MQQCIIIPVFEIKMFPTAPNFEGVTRSNPPLKFLREQNYSFPIDFSDKIKIFEGKTMIHICDIT
jgi:hypothetical protein